MSATQTFNVVKNGPTENDSYVTIYAKAEKSTLSFLSEEDQVDYDGKEAYLFFSDIELPIQEGSTVELTKADKAQMIPYKR